MHKPRPLLHQNPSHAWIKPAQTSPTPASEFFSYTHQTRPNLTNSCVWILLKHASNLHKLHPLLRLNPSHTSIKPVQTSPTPASGFFSNQHQTCTNLTQSCSESFSNKHQNCTYLTHSCVWILLMRAPNLHTPRSLLRLNPSHMSIKPAQISTTLASESFSCLHQTCANLTHSCVWIFLMLASNLQKSHPLLLLSSFHSSIKPVQTSPTPASGFFSNQHQICTNLTQSCLWILLIQASNLRKPHPLLRLNPSHLASNLHKPHPLLLLNSSYTSIKAAQTSPTPASESFSNKHQTCTNLNQSCVWILLIQASKLHKHQPLLCLNPSHSSIKTAHNSLTLASKSLSCEHQTCTHLAHSCV